MEEETKVEEKKEQEVSSNERRIRAITGIYYSNPKVQEILLDFSKNREVIPRYFEGFGKRPDILQYASDIMELVKKGATSFHASEEIWKDPLQLNSDMTRDEASKLRDGWDLLIDVDSQFLDCSKIAARLIISALEQHGIKNYGIKFSGSKGFHIIVSGKAFPKEFDGVETRERFPEWARAISEYLMNYIRRDYNIEAGKIISGNELEKRTNLSKEEIEEVYCTQCNKVARKGTITKFFCPICGMKIERKEIKTEKRKLKCLNKKCTGFLEIENEKEYYYCENCKDENKKFDLNSDKHPENFEKVKGVSAEKVADLDLVLVAPRHLFRAPYSLHEKTSLASVVLKKEEIDKFNPKDASPLNVKVREFMPKSEEEEGRQLLTAALEWKKNSSADEEKAIERKYKNKEFEKVDFSKINEGMFPEPIKKLLKGGLKDGKKRGLFILLTFLRSINYSPEYINNKIREWNKTNEPPLKEGYVKSQIEWHLKQKKQILPPNYNNQGFYKDMGLLDEKPDAKNPISEIARKLRENK